MINSEDKPPAGDGADQNLLAEVRALKKDIVMYKECLDEFVDENRRDEANLFISTYGSALAKDIHRREL